MREHLPDKLRKLVYDRANGCCEYCLIHESTTLLIHEIDHIISIKHKGENDDFNLALACYLCNRSKGSDVGSVINGNFIRFYNPRIDNWKEHFRLSSSSMIEPVSLIGEATELILGFNEIDRIIERNALIKAEKYPFIPKFL